jgi:hypothetical protein
MTRPDVPSGPADSRDPAACSAPDPVAERVARNEAAFREANERIDRRAEDSHLDVSPFLCECANPACTAVISLQLAAYEEIRAHPTHFLNAVGHDKNAQGFSEVIARKPGYIVVAKIGAAAPIAAELDPRGGDPS